MINYSLTNNEQANKLASVVRGSKIIKKLNALPGKFKWEYSSKYDFFEYSLKLYGDNFYSRRIVEIKFNVSNLETSINFYREEKTSKGIVLKPIDVDFYVFHEVSQFLDYVIKKYRLFDKKKKHLKGSILDNSISDSVQIAFDIFGKDFVKVISV